METIVVTTQDELDAALDDGVAEINIESPSNVVIQIIGETNSIIFAYGQSHVYVSDNNTEIVADKNATVYACANTKVYAYEDSKVYAWDKATVTVCEYVEVYAWSGATVYDYSNNTVHVKKSAVVHKYFDKAPIDCHEDGIVVDHTNQPMDATSWRAHHDVHLSEGVAKLYETINQEWGLK